MYLIVKTSNRISNVEKCSFSELGFNERQHLQEWLANHPEAFGEELLIIQKEFAGFDETNERLDLLAIDKEGNLVIIENKLDDTGKDVVWQSIKYASYCSSLSKQQIVQIFQEFIDKEQPSAGADAHTALCNFLDCSDLSETDLNQRTSQRLILVAANYRKEVTSTALWLIDNGLQVQCFKATPYQLTIENNDTYLLNMEQIIPTPEAKDFMINMASKMLKKNKLNTSGQRNKSLGKISGATH